MSKIVERSIKETKEQIQGWTCPRCGDWWGHGTDPFRTHVCTHCKDVPSPSSELLAACDIIRRLLEKVNMDNEYDEHKCPNTAPCGVCKLVAEAGAFIRANEKARVRR